MYWHFPHYSNQGGRPGGAIRDGDWKLVEHYEDGSVELFRLGRDPSEQVDLSRKEIARAAELRRRLAAWRWNSGAQENIPNPAFDPALHRALYVDVDVSRLRPADKAAAMTPGLAAWRKGMDSAGASPHLAPPR